MVIVSFWLYGIGRIDEVWHCQLVSVNIKEEI